MKKITIIIFVLLLGLFEGLSCEGQAAPNVFNDVADVSTIQLIANPNQFDGKLVRFIGFVNFEFEGDAIYVHEEDYKSGITKNALWLNLTDACCKNASHDINRVYVIVEGTFNAKKYGHMGLFSGTIENIKRLEPWVVKRAEHRNPK